ncbi:MAG: hypothetical protein ACI8QS_000518 [Planctomycetota bacterium]|jgi:hypothetical protein
MLIMLNLSRNKCYARAATPLTRLVLVAIVLGIFARSGYA